MARQLRTLERTIHEAETAITIDALEVALHVIRSQIEDWLAAVELTRNAIWGSRELDALVARIGRLVAEFPPLPFELDVERDPTRPLDVYLFTRTEAGGHIGLAGDFIRAAPDRSSIIVLTEQHIVPVPPEFAEWFATPMERIVCLPPLSQVDRTRTLLSLLMRLVPERVFIFNHHQDVSIIAAAGSGVIPAETYYVHHGDFLPALGVFSSNAAHLDVTPRAHTFCRSVLGVPSAYVPLVAPDRGRRPRSGTARGAPVLATCGSPGKYDLSYRVPYHEVVAALLAETEATFYHIGPLFDEQLAAIREAMSDAGVDATRWRHIAFVPSVWQAMEDLGVDLYVNSFPQRGGRVAVEVMGSGTPAVWHLTGCLNRSVDLHLAYPEAAAWSEPAELIEIVQNIDADWMEFQGDAARSRYEKAHHPSLLADIVNRGFRGAPLPASPHERSFAFEFQQLEASWHRLTGLKPPRAPGE
jgi:hypothetical protein